MIITINSRANTAKGKPKQITITRTVQQNTQNPKANAIVLFKDAERGFSVVLDVVV